MDIERSADQSTRLSDRERVALALPLAGSTFVGLFLLLLPTVLASLSGYKGDNLYLYWLTGAATIGYPVALGLALRQGSWAATRLVVAAFFTFGIGSLYACAADIISGGARPIVYVVLVLTLLFMSITGTLLYTHRGMPRPIANIGNWLVVVIAIATVLATVFALFPLFFPMQFVQLFSFKPDDFFIYRQGGAASLGYAVMGVLELRSRNWLEIRWPAVMAAVFNGVSFLASIVALVIGTPPLLPIIVIPVGLGIPAAVLIALRRNGR